jgi:choline kinase
MIETVIIVAAGQGTRLRPLTDDRPKAMVSLHGRPLLEWNLSAAREAGARRIVVVGGYKREAITGSGFELRVNEDFATTNMLYTLLCAEDAFGDGFALLYGDCVYEPDVVASLLRTPFDFSLLVDTDWEAYWRARCEDPLADAETLKLAPGDVVTEIGKKPRSLAEIEAQFCGLVGFQREGVAQLRALRDDAVLDMLSGCPRPWRTMYTTDALQALIERGFAPRAHRIHGGWLEIDNLDDYAVAERCSEPSGDVLRIDRSRLNAG